MNLFDSILGNSKAKNQLTALLEKQKVGQLLLFSGPDGVGKSLFAESFAKKLLNVESLTHHPDFLEVHPEGKLGLHSIEGMRTLCEKISLPPFLAPRKVFVIHAAERMQAPSGNALLKTFEEPSPDTLIILLSSNSSALLPTIISRCRTVRFLPLEHEVIVDFLRKKCGKNEVEANQIALQSAGSIGKAYRLSLKEDLVRKGLLNLLSRQKVQLYSELVETAKWMTELLEEVKKQEEETVKALLLKKYVGDVSAVEMQHLVKESEGAAAILQTNFTNLLFHHILSWYRDVQLLQLNGDQKFLENPDFLKELQTAAKLKTVHTIEAIQKMLMHAKLLLERSTSLNIVLENLFLKLNLL